jgi:hypothetical protein
MSLFRALVASGCLAILSACGVQESVDDAKAMVSVFHADLDAERYEDIWKETAPQMRKLTKEEDFEKLLAAIHRKLGKVLSAEQAGWRTNVTTQGTFIMLGMNSKFEKGQAQESFTYLRNGKDLQLAGYNINSPALVIN